MHKGSPRLPVLLLASAALATPAYAYPPGTEHVLYTFGPQESGPGPSSGRFPYAGLLGNAAGTAFFGVTSQDGVLPPNNTDGGGTLFEITRGPGGTSAVVSILHTFNPPIEGSDPMGGLATDNKSLFGTTALGGTGNDGTVFEWTPIGDSSKFTVLHTFTGTPDGSTPLGTLYRAANGVLYGTTQYGGAYNNGAVFSLTPPAAGQTAWTYAVIASFNGGTTIGDQPLAGVVGDAAGNLYGTNSSGGAGNYGTVFELSPPLAPGGAWTSKALASFTYPDPAGGPAIPSAPLILDSAGNLYGTSYSGGQATGGHYYGTVFEVSPPPTGGTGWTTTVLHSFDKIDGNGPDAPVMFGPGGALYGTTETSGSANRGTVFSLSAPAGGSGPWTFSLLHSFVCDANGGDSTAGFSQAANGQLISTTSVCGSTNSGVIYFMQP